MPEAETGRLTARANLWYTATSGTLDTHTAAEEEVTVSEPFVAEQIIVRAVSDATFRRALAADPKRTLREAGVEVTDDQLKAIELAKPEEWGKLSLEDVMARIDLFYAKR
jgi:hypothetical protein